MSSAAKVGEIFTAAGTAFTKLGELTMQLHTSNSGGSAKWTEEDIALMHNCLTKFANEIDEITSRARLRTLNHLNSSIRKREYEDAGLMSPPINSTLISTPTSATNSTPSKGGRRGNKKLSGSHTAHMLSVSPSSIPPHTEEVTLNMLNASDGDTDLKMDFDSPHGSS